MLERARVRLFPSRERLCHSCFLVVSDFCGGNLREDQEMRSWRIMGAQLEDHGSAEAGKCPSSERKVLLQDLPLTGRTSSPTRKRDP